MRELQSRNDQEKRRELERSGIDLASTKVQMVLGAVLIFLSCLLAYRKTFAVGFLLDDFLHINYIAAVFQGHPGDFLANFSGNWGGSDLMKSYRPLISLTLFIDYLVYHTKAAGYHLSNFLYFYFDCILVSLITLEITGRLKSRLGAVAALWAGLLFSVYPLHGESVAWIIGRVDTVATFFYLGSIELFLRQRLTFSGKYHRLSLLAFFFALTSKEIAVTLPVVIFMAALLPESIAAVKSGKGIRRNFLRAIRQSLPYWLILAAFAVLRHFLLGTTIGGYGADSPLSVLSGMRNFLDKASLIKVFVPISEEYQSIGSVGPFSTLPLIAIASIYALRSLLDREKGQGLPPPLLALSVNTILLGWLILAALPAFQIWHIYPNLVGSRLFFLSSVPLCILVSLMAMPALDAFGKREAKVWTGIGLVALSALYLSWSHMLAVNLRCFREAGLRMRVFKQELVQRLAFDSHRRILLLNLPQDYKGAGMVGRRLYLDILLRQPFVGTNLSGQVVTLDSFSQGKTAYIDMTKLSQALKDCNEVLYFNNDGAFFQSRETTIKPSFSEEKLSFAPASKTELASLCKDVQVLDGETWRKAEDSKRIDMLKEKIMLMPSQNSSAQSQKMTMHLPWPLTLSLDTNGPLLIIDLDKKAMGGLADLIIEDQAGREVDRLPLYESGNSLVAYVGALKVAAQRPVTMAVEFNLPPQGIGLKQITLVKNDKIKPDQDGKLSNLPDEQPTEIEEDDER